MTDQWISYEDTVDILACNQGPDNYWILNRDPARTPFQCEFCVLNLFGRIFSSAELWEIFIQLCRI
jgi:hypothetical protein